MSHIDTEEQNKIKSDIDSETRHINPNNEAIEIPTLNNALSNDKLKPDSQQITPNENYTKKKGQRKSLTGSKLPGDLASQTTGLGTKKDKEEEKEKDEKDKESDWKERLDYYLEHNYTTFVMTIITLYALFGDDIRILVTNKNGDQYFWVLNALAMFAFGVEMIISSLVKKGYWLGFFFWLDLVSTISLLLDIGWFQSAVFQSGADNGAASAATLAKASRASRIGTKAGRIVRIVRLIRLVKLYKHAQQVFATEIEDELLESELQNQKEEQANQNQVAPQSQQGRQKAKKNKKHEEQNRQSLNQMTDLTGKEPQNIMNQKLPPIEEGERRESVLQQYQENDDDETKMIKANGTASEQDKKSVSQHQKTDTDINDKPLQIDVHRGDPDSDTQEKMSEDEEENEDSDEKDSEEKDSEDEEKDSQEKDSEENQSQKNDKNSQSNDNDSQKSKQQSINDMQRSQQKNSQDDLENKKTDDEQKKEDDQKKEENQEEDAALKQDAVEEDTQKQKEGEVKPEEVIIAPPTGPKETKVGQKLSDLTTRRVITLVISIMFSVPIFTTETYYENTVSYDQGMYELLIFNDNEVLLNQALSYYIDFHLDPDEVRNAVIYVDLSDIQFATANNEGVQWPSDSYSHRKDEIPDWQDLRNDELQYYTLQDDSDEVIAFSIVNVQGDYELDAVLSIVRTIFVSIILGGGAMLFSKDVQELVLEPIQDMLEKVERISNNPLEAAQMEEKSALEWELMKKKGLTKELEAKKEQEKMETAILEKLIIKIGALLALGFGEAGSEIIAQNMSNTGSVNPIQPGKKMIGIFGFCNIHNFQDVTQVLQRDIMIFVNEIAEITHSIVDKYNGQSNKNMGEAFLLIWRYTEQQFTVDPTTKKIELNKDPFLEQFTDLSIAAMLKIIAAIEMSKKLHKYQENAKITEKIEKYKVQMGFGLHMGWAIEGAIGSEFKIDASYLSPNVNMAAKLAVASKQYELSLLISGEMYNQLSESTQAYCRLIDRVQIKGAKEPVSLYTVDVHQYNLMQYTQIGVEYNKKENNQLNMDQKKKKRVLQRMWRKNYLEELKKGTQQVSQLFYKEKDLSALVEPFTQEFVDLWDQGFIYYTNGEWEEAKEIFEQTLTQIPNYKDGPSSVLLQFMENYEFKCPEDWQGYRQHKLK